METRSENKTYIWLWNGILSLNGIGLTTCKDDRRTGRLGPVRDGHALLGVLQHDDAHLFHTLNDGLRDASNSDGPLSGVGEHVPCHLDLSSCTLWGKKKFKYQRKQFILSNISQQKF